MKRLKQTRWVQFVVLHRRLLLILGSIIFLSVALGVLGFLKKSEHSSADKVIFVVDGDEYTESTVNHLIDFPLSRGLSREESVAQAFDLAKKKKVAEKLNIVPSEQDVEVQKQELIKNLKNEEEFSERYAAWFNLLAYTNAVDEYVGTTPNTGYKGYMFEIPFGQHIQYGPAFSPEGLNDPRLIEADKKYAQQRVDYYHDKLKNNSISPDQVIKELNNDRKLSALPSGNATQSVKFGFDPEVNWTEEIYYRSVSDFITQQDNTGLSDIKIGQASIDSTPENKTDLYFYFVLLDKTPQSNSVSKQTFQEELSKLNAELKGF